MGWRQLSLRLATGFTAVEVGAAQATARRGAHTPRPPPWAAGALRRRSGAPPSSGLAASAPSSATHVAAAPALSPVTPPFSRGSASPRSDEPIFTSSHSAAAAAESFRGETAAGPSPSPHAATGMRSRTEGVGTIATPPPNSYAYVHAASTTKVPAQPQHSAAAAAGKTTSTAPKHSHTFVTVEGETGPIAAAPAALRRALQRGGPSGSTNAGGDAATQSAALERFEELVSPVAALAARQDRDSVAGASPPASADAASAPVGFAERQARRSRLRRTRELRSRRQHERLEESSGSTRHPCRLQGGCHHLQRGEGGQSSPARAMGSHSCPYRSFPAEACVALLREGHCEAHHLGCCPWTHSDSSGGGPHRDAAVPRDDVHDGGFSLSSPFAIIETAEARAELQRSAERVGALLRLCMDAAVAALEDGATAEERRTFAQASSAGGGQRWQMLRSALATAASREAAELPLLLQVQCAGGQTTESQVPGQTLPYVLAVPAELAWCAMAGPTDGEAARGAAANEYEAELMGLSGSATLHDSAAAVVEPAAMSAAECAYWSSFFNCDASAPAADETAETVQTTALHVPQVRLAPCVSAWVLDMVATQVAPAIDKEGMAAVAPSSLSPLKCLELAVMHQLGWRQAELTRALHLRESSRGETEAESASTVASPSQARHTEGSGSADRREVRRARRDLPSSASGTAETRQRWAAVSLLRDLLMASHITTREGSDSTAVDLDDSSPFPEALSSSSSSVFSDSDNAIFSTRGAVSGVAHTTLLQRFLGTLTTTKAGGGHDDAALAMERGSRFCLDTAPHEPPVGGQTAPLPAGAATSPAAHASSHRHAGSSAAEVRAACEETWSASHRVLLQLQWGLLVSDHGGLASRHDADVALPARLLTSPLLLPSAVALALYLQPALLHLAAAFSTAFSHRHLTDIRRLRGWQPWTDQQLFARESAAVYNAAAYAQHYLPVAQLGLHNSLLNGLLVVSTRRADDAFGLGEPSSVRQLLLRGPPATVSRSGGAAERWWAAVGQGEHRFRQQHLRPFVAHSLGILTALQELSKQQLAAQQALMQEYEQRRAAHEAVEGPPQQQQQQLQGNAEGTATRTRKYRRPSQHDQLAAQRQRLEELRGVPLLDRLLPVGSASVGPDAASALLRQLLEGGHPFKALKLAASIVHASRMLRHADKQPRPTLESGHRTVHRRVWSRRTQRHVLVKTHVPVLRLVGDVASGEAVAGAGDRPGAQARKAVRPVGLVFSLGARLAEEMARVGLRMGEAGQALADGVQQECLRGALVDFTDGRALPAPSWAAVEEWLACPIVGDGLGREAGIGNGSSSSNSTHKTMDGLLRLLGDTAAPLWSSSSAGPLQPSRQRTTLREEERLGAPHRRIVPTPLLLEVLQCHTRPSDTARHTAYLRFLLQDVARFSTWPVLFALQYQACDPHSRYKTARLDSVGATARAMETIYTAAATALCRTPAALTHPSPPAEHDGLRTLQRQLRQQAEASALRVRDWLLSDPSGVTTTHDGRSVSSAAALASSTPTGPLRLPDVKALLSGDEGQRSDADGRDGGEDGSEQNKRVRRAKLQLPVLLHHVWTATLQHKSAQQQCIAAWAVSAATLLGTTRSGLAAHDHLSKAGEAIPATAALHHSYAAAGVLMRLHAPQHAARFIDATVRALLLSHAFEGDRGDFGRPDRLSAAQSEAAATPWPMLISSSHTPAVTAVAHYMTLQRTLLTSLLDSNSSSMDGGSSAAFYDSARLLLAAFEAAHGAVPVPVKEDPSWLLFEPLLHPPQLAQRWLRDSFLFPSSELLVWLVAAVERGDVEGYALLHTWLRHLPSSPHLDEGARETLCRETERRHRGALTRHQRHRATKPGDSTSFK